MLINLGYGLSRPYTAASKLPGDSVVALFGDSLEAHNGYGNATAGTEEYSIWSRGSYSWCRILDPRGRWDNWFDASKSPRYFQGQNQGVSGNNTTQMVARKSDIYNITGVKVVVQGGGTNDIQQDETVAAIIANHANCIAEWKSRGIKTILLTPPPRPTSGTDSWASASARRLAWVAVCAGMQALADADPAWVQVVRRDLICSNNDADRTPRTGHLQADNVHLTPIGGYHIAADSGGLVENLANWIDPFTGFPAAVQSGDLCSNPTLSGSAGTVTAPCTGVAPTGLRMRRVTGSQITAVGSKETINGQEYFKVVITRNGSGNTETLAVDMGGNISSGLPAVGSWMRHAMKFKMNASTGIFSVHLQAREQPSSPANMNNYTMRTDTGILWANTALSAPDGGGLWQISPPWQFRAGGTSILFNLLINVDNTVAGTDTVWFSCMHLYPVSDPKISLGF